MLNQSSINIFYLLAENINCSQICIQWSLLGQKDNGHIRRLTAYLRSFDLDCQIWSVLIRVLLLMEDNLLETRQWLSNSSWCFCNN